MRAQFVYGGNCLPISMPRPRKASANSGCRRPASKNTKFAHESGMPEVQFIEDGVPFGSLRGHRIAYPAHMASVSQSGGSRGDIQASERLDISDSLLAESIRQGPRSQRAANGEACQAMNLVEGATDENVGSFPHQEIRGAGLKIRREFKIGLVNNDRSALRALAQEAIELLIVAEGSGWIMRVDDIERTGPSIDPCAESGKVILVLNIKRRAHADIPASQRWQVPRKSPISW